MSAFTAGPSASSAAALLDGGIVSAAAALRRGDLSIVDLVTEALARIDRTSGLNAYIEVYADDALRLAAAHQTLLDSGYDLGPLHGLPVALKDNIDLAGRRTTAGSAFLDRVPEEDSHVSAALKRAGAIIVGKNNLHEFAWGGTSANEHFGVVRNAWDPARSPGGSSGGSAVAVATGSVFASIGTDTGGSVRLPAALSGVSGIRPSIGRVSNRGVFPLAWTLDATGPLARSAEDCAIVLKTIAGPDAHDRATSDAPVPDYPGLLARSLGGLRVGWLADYSLTDVERPVENAFRAALEAFAGLGASVVEVRLTELDALIDAVMVIDAAEPTTVHHAWLQESNRRYAADIRSQLEAGAVFSAVDYLQAQRYRSHLQSQFEARFAEVDVILTPTVPYTVPLIGQTEFQLGGEPRELHRSNMRFTALASATGLPAMSVPMGYDEAGLPLGLQVIAPAFAEARLLRVGHQFERATGHHRTPYSSAGGVILPS